MFSSRFFGVNCLKRNANVEIGMCLADRVWKFGLTIKYTIVYNAVNNFVYKCIQ